jgi:hypothetical protein
LELPSGIEPDSQGFADLCITILLRQLKLALVTAIQHLPFRGVGFVRKTVVRCRHQLLPTIPKHYSAQPLLLVKHRFSSPVNNGAVGEDRTPDLMITNQLLYQLSYNSKLLV